jgi:hypothetical protein
VVQTSKALKFREAARLGTGVANEGDVVLIANIHLVDPVLKSVNEIYHGQLTSYAEEPIDKLRVNRAIKLKQRNKDQVIMLIEYKRCGYIHKEQFEQAMCAPKNAHQILCKLKEAAEETTLQSPSNTLWFVKQATAYYINTGCRYVALCDYESLILSEYSDPPENNHLDYVGITVVPRPFFRKALLGFLIEACEAAGLN